MQIDALKAAGCERIFEEIAAGVKDDREKLNELLAQARRGDAIVVYSLDRFERSTEKLLDLTEELERRGIELISIDTTTAVGKG